MRICLFWNETAGEGVSAASLTELITRAGHGVARVVEDVDELESALDSSIECVAAAGGDGTVAKVGRVLAGGEIPLAILPLGTANNIAESLAIRGTAAELIEKWSDHRIVRIDVGVVQDSSGTDYFLEGVGTGLIVAGITVGRAEIKPEETPDEQLQHARRLYVDRVDRLAAQTGVVTIDGHEIQDRYLSIEILNTPSVGPRLRLSADVHAADGYLSVVTAGEADRKGLADYLQASLKGPVSPRLRGASAPEDAGLKAIRAERVELSGVQEIHVDDKVRNINGERIAIGIKPGFLALLA